MKIVNQMLKIFEMTVKLNNSESYENVINFAVGKSFGITSYVIIVKHTTVWEPSLLQPLLHISRFVVNTLSPNAASYL